MTTERLSPPAVRIDIGSGPKPKDGFEGVDIIAFPGVTQIDLRAKWPWADDSVDEANCSHFLEHLTNFNDRWERVRFFNELHRVLKPGAKCLLTIPHWSSTRYYGDPTHKEPFSEMGFYYLSREWRATQAPHTDIANTEHGYSCDLEATWGYSLRQDIAARSIEFQQFAMANYKEACMDIIATLTKKHG